MLDKDEFLKIKKLILKSIVSNDILMNKLVLKGGSCLELAYKLHSRSSKDIDFSIKDEFSKEERGQILNNLPDNFNAVFKKEGYQAFDFSIKDKPTNLPEDIKMSGYSLKFKLITNELYEKYSQDIAQLRNRALSLGQSTKKDFVIDISKYEYVDTKEEKDIDEFKVFVYPPQMIVCEKLRAICQKMKEYRNNLGDVDLPRARDFYDIYLVQENLQKIDFKNPENREILKHVFEAKNVDLNLLSKIKEKRHIHEDDFRNVLLTDIVDKKHPEIFDYYFEYVLDMVADLEEFWVE